MRLPSVCINTHCYLMRNQIKTGLACRAKPKRRSSKRAALAAAAGVGSSVGSFFKRLFGGKMFAKKGNATDEVAPVEEDDMDRYR